MGAVLAGLGLACALVLAASEFPGVTPPGCGGGGGCGALKASPLHGVPGTGIPSAFVGVVYFGVCLALTLIGRAGVSGACRWVFRLGALASAVYVGEMVRQGSLCPWCAGCHVANFALLGWVELSARLGGRATAANGKAGLVAGAVAVGLSAAIGVAWVVLGAAASAETDRIIDEDRRALADGGALDGAGSGEKYENPEPRFRVESPIDLPVSGPGRAGLTGRYLLGPEEAVARIVMWTAYQCPDCQAFERELVALVSTRSDVSVSIKQFPWDSACNPAMNQTVHDSDCLAASYAEAAGILAGPEGFWAMHTWLFDRLSRTNRTLTRAEVLGYAQSIGIEPQALETAAGSPEVARRIGNDSKEAREAGLAFTPMVLINGSLYRGWRRPGALAGFIDAGISDGSLTVGTSASDAPPTFVETALAEWQGAPVARGVENPLAPVLRSSASGDSGAPGAMFVVWLPYDSAEARTVDREVRRLVEAYPGVGYSIRYYPRDSRANAGWRGAPNEVEYALTRVAFAAAFAAEPEGFWALHDKAMALSPGSATPEVIEGLIKGLGEDEEAVRRELGDPGLDGRIRRDAKRLDDLGGPGAPAIYLNGRRVLKWLDQGEPILEVFVRDALGLD